MLLPRYLVRRSASSLRSVAGRRTVNASQRRMLVAPPKPGSGPLMERRSDRDLPDVEGNRFRWSRTLPLFVVLMGLSSVAIFNYQKSSSPVVSSALYALRTNRRARELLGDEIYFSQAIPWISGEMNQLHGRIDIRFTVKGTRATAVMRFASRRPTTKGLYETTEWSLEAEDGHKIDLLEDGDPFRVILSEDGLGMFDEEQEQRGFRQAIKTTTTTTAQKN